MSLTLEKPAQTRSLGKLNREVGERIRLRRKQLHLKLADVAGAVGTTPQTIQRLETGNMTLSVDWIESLAKVLQMEPFELFADGVVAKALDIAFKARLDAAGLRAAFKTFCSVVEEACHEQTKP